MSPGNRAVDRWVAKYNRQRSEEIMAKSDKAPSSSGEHEAVRRLQDELARGEALTEAIATGASLPPASPIPREEPPDTTPATLPPMALRDSLEDEVQVLRSLLLTRNVRDQLDRPTLEGLLRQVDLVLELARRRRRSPPAF